MDLYYKNYPAIKFHLQLLRVGLMQLKKTLFLVIHSSHGERGSGALWHFEEVTTKVTLLIQCQFTAGWYIVPLTVGPQINNDKQESPEKMTHTLLISTDKELLRLWGPVFSEVKFFPMQYTKHTIRVCLPLFNFSSTSEQNSHLSEIGLLCFMVLTILITNFSKHSRCILPCTDGFRHKIQWFYSRRT